jgi:hypothetical protein
MKWVFISKDRLPEKALEDLVSAATGSGMESSPAWLEIRVLAEMTANRAAGR